MLWGRWLVVSMLLVGVAAAADEADPRGVEFFEAKIRPVLVQHCYECHSGDANEIKAGLRVDSRAGLRAGGDSGPAVVPEKPAESLLLSALRGEDYAMPPDGLLPAEVIADFETWIKMGAPDPREGETPVAEAPQIDLEAGRQFWSFRPPAVTAPPMPKDAQWCRTDIDRFIRAQQEAAALAPGADAKRRVLIRRAYFDLIGLPPTPEEVAAFVTDETPDAWSKLIDRLLESPQFGARWGRHWLDVARYADSTGGGRSLLYGDSWRYRDYVIDAFNRDKPFDRFIVEQIAGDLLPFDDLVTGAEQLTATAFLALGPSNYEEQDKELLRMDVIDEQIDTVGRAFLGMTLGCARCHDHKFDPVPTADYYALAGIFRSTQTLIHENVSTWVKRPVPVEAERRAHLDAYSQQLTELEASVKSQKQRVEVCELEARQIGGILACDDETTDRRYNTFEFTGSWTISKGATGFVGKGYRYASGSGATAVYTFKDGVAGEYDVRVSYSPHANRAANALVRVQQGQQSAEVRIDQRQPPPIDGLFISACSLNCEGLASAPVTVTISTDGDGAEGIVVADAVQLVLRKSDATDPGQLSAAQSELVAAQEQMKSLQAKLESHKQARPEFPPEVMSVQDEAECGDYAVCVRGNAHQLGDKAPRGFLSVIVGAARPAIPSTGSGRRELAHWIASSENPLTARVIVNRVWAHLFEQGLVRTVDNFGATGETPSHPELLDGLAARFVAQGWSIKSLIRELMLSRTYQLTSAGTSPSADPDNRLLTHQNRKRLEVESLFDALLSLSGELDTTVGGDSVRSGTKREYGYEFEVGRRAVYLPVFRNELPPGFAEFDFPDPNLSVGKRTTTTLSTQALLLMNSPLVLEQARRAAETLAADEPDPTARIGLLFERALGRPPSDVERELALEFAQSDSSERWTALCLSVIGSIDFRYIE